MNALEYNITVELSCENDDSNNTSFEYTLDLSDYCTLNELESTLAEVAKENGIGDDFDATVTDIDFPFDINMRPIAELLDIAIDLSDVELTYDQAECLSAYMVNIGVSHISAIDRHLWRDCEQHFIGYFETRADFARTQLESEQEGGIVVDIPSYVRMAIDFDRLGELYTSECGIYENDGFYFYGYLICSARIGHGLSSRDQTSYCVKVNQQGHSSKLTGECKKS